LNALSFDACVRFSLQLMLSGAAFAAIMPRREHFAARLAGGLAAYFAAAYAVFTISGLLFGGLLVGEIVYYCLLLAAALAMTHFCFDISQKELVFLGTGAYAVQNLIFNLLQLLYYLPLIGKVLAAQNIWLRGLPYLLVPVAVYLLFVRHFETTGELKEKDNRMLALAAITLFITVVVSLLARRTITAEEQRLVCWLYGTLCCVLVLFLLMYFPKENRLYSDQKLLEQVIQVMGEQQKSTRESMEIINVKCHDIKHQLNALMEMDDKEQRRKCTEEIRQAVSIYEAVYHTGNTPLDFVLREKSLLCQEYQIKFSCLTDGKELGFLETLDIYALFGNILDNAIESVAKEPDAEKRIINLHVLRRAQMLHIHADNYCAEAIAFEDGLPVTTKKDKAYHGFGVRSIRHIAEKYGGELLLKKAEDRFVLDVLIPVPGPAAKVTA